MITCTHCGTANEAGQKFCGECGHSLAVVCPNCGTPNQPSMKFCGECGTGLRELAPAAAAPTGAERRLVTVLFADLTGYTSFSEGRDPEDVRNMLTDYFDRSREVIERFGGVVDKFIGDAVMAVWGAVVTNDDDAERAVRAGLELVDTVAKMASDQGSPELALRVGVLTGEASVGPGGNEKGLVVGDLVNTASRLQSIAEPGTVLVGEPTMRAASAGISFEPLGEQTVKGKQIPVAVFRANQILGEVGGGGRADVLEPPFVGRAQELRLLKDLRESVGRDNRARHVSIIGEGGIGKSRLVWEFQKYSDGLVETTYWHQGRSPAYGDGVAFWAVKEMIHRRAGILETDDDETVIAGVDRALEEFLSDEDADWVRPRLHAVLGVGSAPSGARSELDSAVRIFFQGVAKKAPVVMVFEDLQWADAGVIEFAEDLTEWSRDYPILVITLARTELLERRPEWGSKGRTVTVRLGPMASEEMRSLVVGTMPDLGHETVSAIVERSGGVPLFAVELMRGLSDGAIGKIPETIQAAIGSRLDRLESDQRSLVQDAAILGQTFTIEALSAVTGVSSDDAGPILSFLVKKELIEPVRDPRSPERGQYRFVQSMIREVALSRLNRDIRRERHLAAAHYLIGREDPELAPVVADHFIQAYQATPEGPESDALRGTALETLLGALRRAEDVRSYELVLSTGETALELCETDAERAPIWESMALAASHHAQPDRAYHLGTLALEHARSSATDEDEDRVVALLGDISVVTRREGTIELLQQHLEKREGELSNNSLIQVASKLAHAMMFPADPYGLEVADKCLAAAEQIKLWPVLVDTLITKAVFLEANSRSEEARVLIQGAIALADEHDLAEPAIRGRINGDFLTFSSDPVAARTMVAEALELARRVGNRSLAQFSLINMVIDYLRHGDRDLLTALLDDPLQETMPDQSRGRQAGALAIFSWFDGDESQAARHLETMEGLETLVINDQYWFELSKLFTEGPEASFDALAAFAAENRELYRHSLEMLGNITGLSGDRSLLDRVNTMADSHPAHHTLITRQPRSFVSAIEGDSQPARETADLYLTFPWTSNAIFTLAGAANFLPKGHPDAQPFLDEAFERAEAVGWMGLRDLIARHVVL
ncbi:MAG: adenylate/guanylate cyclase domain-containing protein [Acidimicrobiia bacterium]|nr:adenylate/guanylate cyclase domain-containing protein [Acidimicrobiia bacterium]